jgi:cytoplasmic iron level regulating protein YaaA (DUF328/UPF0246 family)
MLILISPAKILNFKNDSPTQKYSQPLFIEQAKKITAVLKNFSPANLKELMEINSVLSELNYLRIQKWQTEHFPDNSKQAIFAFNGEVYNGLKAHTLSTESLLFAQKHLRVLSGLYGILCPLDLIQPYRLEMSTPLKFDKFQNLYHFWGDKICNVLSDTLKEQQSKTIINLASHEYVKAARLNKIKGRVINIVFKEFKGDNYKVIVVYTKKARGLMTRFILDNKIEDPEELKLFDAENYAFSSTLSSANEWVFTR